MRTALLLLVILAVAVGSGVLAARERPSKGAVFEVRRAGDSQADGTRDHLSFTVVDTIWLGADSAGTTVVEGGVWDFDNRGTLTCSAEDEPSVYIKNGAFAQGWTSEDSLEQNGLYWHAEDFTDPAFACSVNPITGTFSAWCGRLAADPGECFKDPPGYGHGWNQWLCRTVTLDPVTPRLTYNLNSDTEPGFDYVYVLVDNEFPDSCGWVGDNADTIRCYNGSYVSISEDIDLTNLAADPDLCDLIPTNDYSGDSVKICVVVVSSNSRDDEDGQYVTCDGACTLDDVSIDVAYSSGEMIITDFEDGSLEGWQACGGWSSGDYAAIRDEGSFINNDPHVLSCGMEGCVLAFFNPMIPGQYGNGGHYAGSTYDRAWSPAIDLSSYPPRQYAIRYDVYADLPHMDYILFSHWASYVPVSSCSTGAWSPPITDGIAYYSDTPDCMERIWDFSALVPADAESVKIGFSVFNHCRNYEASCTNGNESPIFDNVALRIIGDFSPLVMVVTPNGGEAWCVGDTEDITWMATDASGVDSVSIYYSTNSGGDWTLLASQEPNDGTYPWTIPDTPTEVALVKVAAYDPDLNVGEDVSDAVFTIVESTPPVVTVTAPNGAEIWYVGNTEDVTWTATDASGVDSVSIYYSSNSGGDWTLLASQEPNDGTYPWTIPDTPTEAALVKVEAYDHNLNVGEDVSDAVFMIVESTPPSVTVTAPNGGETWYVGNSEDITWTATDASGVDSVSVYYSTNSGDDWTPVASQEPNDGIYPWAIPSTPTDSALVKVIAYDSNLNAGEDVSDSQFAITAPDLVDPVVTVLAPNGEETWYAGDTEDITWTATDASGVDSVVICYSVNAGVAYTLIASGEPNDGVYSWTLPDTLTVSALVKVEAYDPSLNTGEDESDAVFTIADGTSPVVTVLAPNGGETWYACDSEDITWTATDASGVDSVSIYYSLNGGWDYALIASGEANDGVCPWNVPDTPSDSALVSIVAYDPSLNAGRDTSDAMFEIAPQPVAQWMVDGDQGNAQLGYSVSSAGDVNGDGYDDVIVGAYLYDNNEPDEGRAYVYHGSATGLSSEAAWTAESDQAGAMFGSAVSGAGDVNGDGYDDVIVGAREYDNFGGSEGRAYVYHGSPSGLSPTAAWTAEMDEASARFGSAVSSAGDVNEDGYDDVIVGAHYYGAAEGRAYVYHGSSSGLSATAAWMIEGDQAFAQLGNSVSGAGDINGDGYADVIVGAQWYSNGESYEGRAYVYHGSPSGLSTTAAWTGESDQAGAHYGESVSSAGDVNSDGYGDVIVGAGSFNTVYSGEGRAYVYHGGPGGLSSLPDWTADGDQTNASLGTSVSSAGDVNGDGNSDVIIGAELYNNGESGEGRAFVYRGGFAGLSATADSTMESDQVNAAFGHCVSTAGDVNGDGNSDLIVGAHGYDHCDPEEGCAFVYYGPFVTVDVPEEPGPRYTNALLQNYPNPFRVATGTTILYSLESPGRAALRICDANGRLVRTISDRAEVGENRLFWDGKADDGGRVPSGVYFCQLKTGDFTSQKKLMLVQ